MALVSATSVLDESFDVVIFINDTTKNLGDDFAPIEEVLTAYERVILGMTLFLLLRNSIVLLFAFPLGQSNDF